MPRGLGPIGQAIVAAVRDGGPMIVRDLAALVCEPKADDCGQAGPGARPYTLRDVERTCSRLAARGVLHVAEHVRRSHARRPLALYAYAGAGPSFVDVSAVWR